MYSYVETDYLELAMTKEAYYIVHGRYNNPYRLNVKIYGQRQAGLSSFWQCTWNTFLPWSETKTLRNEGASVCKKSVCIYLCMTPYN